MEGKGGHVELMVRMEKDNNKEDGEVGKNDDGDNDGKGEDGDDMEKNGDEKLLGDKTIDDMFHSDYEGDDTGLTLEGKLLLLLF